VLRSARYLSLIKFTKPDYVLNNLVSTQTIGTFSKGNLLDNKLDRDESCIES